MTILLLLKIVEVLERILESGPSHVAEILGIDDYVAQIIFSETNNKNTSNIISNYNFSCLIILLYNYIVSSKEVIEFLLYFISFTFRNFIIYD